jgi:Family of unknown function (DUF5996)
MSRVSLLRVPRVALVALDAADRTHASYDADYANRFWRILVSADPVLKEFRGRFIGKASPVLG